MDIVKVDYGKDGLNITLDSSWNTTIFHPERQEAIDNPVEAIRKLVQNPVGTEPLEKIIRSKKEIKSVCIVVSDATRPVPSHIILKALIEELNNYGINDNQITFLIATGSHRPSHEDELKRILGVKLKNRMKTINHVATDKNSLVKLEQAAGKNAILINKHYYYADLKILTGYVEPHFFFGFSGGRKSVAPGIMGSTNIQEIHSSEMIASPYARFGVFKENPLHKSSIEITKLAGVDFIVNVCINEKHKIVQIVAGEFEKAHERLVDYQYKNIFKQIKKTFDIVVCGNGGYPLDLNLYQAVKSMAIGEMAVKEGGTIISVNECIDGIGQEEFQDLLNSGLNPKKIYDKILNKEIIVRDQWEIQILTRILMKADIFVVSKLHENEIGNIGLKYATTVEDAIKECLGKYGNNASILILPNGPQVLPILK
ncbi:MAG: nickel-dependent lactate racemase family protein [Promethearchaeota archaeon]